MANKRCYLIIATGKIRKNAEETTQNNGKTGRCFYEHFKIYTEFHAGGGEMWEVSLRVRQSGDRAGASAVQFADDRRFSDLKADREDGNSERIFCKPCDAGVGKAGQSAGRPGLYRPVLK